MKKVISLIVAVMMIMALIATPAFADDVTGTITIQNAVSGNVYSIYKIFDLESFQGSAFSYTITADWADFFAAGNEGAPYIAIHDEKYVTWIAGEDAATVETFAKLALEYAKGKGINPLKTATGAGTDIVFSDLALGYYLVDSSMGALCGLTTTATDAVITAKNAAPTLTKYVQEDSLTEQADNGWRSENTADIGQAINYMVSIDVHDGSENFVLHDKMDEGITFVEINRIEHVVPGSSTTTLTSADYTLVTETNNECDFHIEFTDTFCEKLNKNDKIVVYYSATLNTSAVIGSDGNVNAAWLTFGDVNADGTQNHKTSEATTITRTWGVDIVKTTSTGQLLDGATFKLYNALVDGAEILVVRNDDGTYRLAVTEAEKAAAVNIVINAVNGKARINGLDNGNYYLEEIEAPEGYNKLAARQVFTISDSNYNAQYKDNGDYNHSGVQVINKTGSILPTTGGMGTTIFVTLGGLAVLAAGVVLFAKKRMSQIAE